MSTPDALAEVVETFDQLLTWGSRVSRSFAPPPGSILATDDTVFPPMSTSDVAWQALCAAQDHLKGFRAWVLSAEQTGLFPIATFSLLRGALVGGSTATWVLSSDDREVRVGRSLAIAADWYSHLLNWAEGMSNHAVDAAEHQRQLEHVAARREEVKRLRADREPKGKPLQTTIVRQATAEIWPGDTARDTATMGIWRAGSGDAHALGWSMLTRGYEMTPLGEGFAQFASAPRTRDVADAYLCAYDFVAFGFHRLDELSTAPGERPGN